MSALEAKSKMKYLSTFVQFTSLQFGSVVVVLFYYTHIPFLLVALINVACKLECIHCVYNTYICARERVRGSFTKYVWQTAAAI